MVHDQAGHTLLELLVSVALMTSLTGSMSILMGAAIRSKLIIAVRTADTETARQALEWMSERLRNAGLNLNPDDPAQSSWPSRCQDMVVAQDSSLRPTASSAYVSGEILNTDATAGNEVMTIGYLLGNDPATGKPVVMESRQPCGLAGAPTVTPLSDPKLAVSGLGFEYYSDAGVRITALTDAAQIQRIRFIRISLTVQGAQGASGPQAQTFTRDVLLRNPDPGLNDWKNLGEIL